MNDRHQRNPSAYDGVPDLLDDFRRRRDALQTEARELVQLQADVLSAAEREGAEIVANARAQISRVLVDARRDLQGLATRIQSVAGLERDDVVPLFRDSQAAQESLQRARREIARALEDAKPELEQLRQEASTHGSGAPREERPSLAPVPAPDWPVPAPDWPPPAPDWPPAPADPAIPAPEQWAFEMKPRRRQPAVWMIAFAIAALATILGAVWVVRQSANRDNPPPAKSALPTTPSTNPGSVPTPAQPKPSVQRPLALTVEARRPVWIGITIDGRGQSGFFKTGQQSQIAADNEVAIRAGDAGAVSVSVNGGAAQVLGRDGEVVTRRFTTDSLKRAAEPTPRTPVSSPPPAAPPARAIGDPGGRAAAPPPPTNNASAPAMELTTTAQRWLDAYHRQDLAAMRAVATRDMKRTDQRSASERLPQGADNVRRTLENVSFQFVGETAILAARMIEQGNVGGQGIQHISWISLMWIRESGQWLMADVQILSDAKLRSR